MLNTHDFYNDLVPHFIYEINNRGDATSNPQNEQYHV